MEFSPTFTHTTFSPVLLLLLAIVASGVVTLCVLRQKWRFGVGLALASSAILVWLAGEHVPVVSSFAPATFCFGSIALPHIVAFALPLAALAIRAMRRVSPSVG